MNFLILIFLIPIAVFWLARWYFFRKVIDELGAHDCRISVETIAEKLHFTGKMANGIKEKRSAEHLAEMMLLFSYHELKKNHPQPVMLRKRADTWITVAAPFSIMIAVFAFFVSKNHTLILICLSMVNALAAIFKLTTRHVASLAADHAMESLRRIRIPRQSDEEVVIACIKASVWK